MKIAKFLLLLLPALFLGLVEGIIWAWEAASENWWEWY